MVEYWKTGRKKSRTFEPGERTVREPVSEYLMSILWEGQWEQIKALPNVLRNTIDSFKGIPSARESIYRIICYFLCKLLKYNIAPYCLADLEDQST